MTIFGRLFSGTSLTRAAFPHARNRGAICPSSVSTWIKGCMIVEPRSRNKTVTPIGARAHWMSQSPIQEPGSRCRVIPTLVAARGFRAADPD